MNKEIKEIWKGKELELRETLCSGRKINNKFFDFVQNESHKKLLTKMLNVKTETESYKVYDELFRISYCCKNKWLRKFGYLMWFHFKEKPKPKPKPIVIKMVLPKPVVKKIEIKIEEPKNNVVSIEGRGSHCINDKEFKKVKTQMENGAKFVSFIYNDMEMFMETSKIVWIGKGKNNE